MTLLKNAIVVAMIVAVTASTPICGEDAIPGKAYEESHKAPYISPTVVLGVIAVVAVVAVVLQNRSHGQSVSCERERKSSSGSSSHTSSHSSSHGRREGHQVQTSYHGHS